ncbi:MAG: (d)CMP kinase [Candidatus Omnitrophica bacterium]|nr:(d)CMP kinase [Candidatus Omnitrophota bacterium]
MIFFGKTEAVAVDGPAGSGKSTVARLAADKLGFVYIDTGAMYRALTLKVMSGDVALEDIDRITALSEDMDFRFVPSPAASGPVKVMLDGEDVTDDIRKMEVTVKVKHVCAIPRVRGNLVELQRKMAREGSGTVMEGRDIGTVVLPDARYKFYLDASFDERVERRLSELRAKGTPVSREDIADDLKQRDHTDKTREVGPLKKAEDAELVDTTDLNIEQVVDVIVDKVRSGDTG